MKTVLITGASSGIGKETAKLFVQNKFRVVATARNLDRMVDLHQLGCLTVKMDVTEEASIQEAFTLIQKQVGPIHVLVNNAGFSQNGFVEELTMEQLRYQFEVNVFGLLRVSQMVLPAMRAAHSGTIVNVGSVGGDFTSAGASAYHASKYALESLTDGMRQELAWFGINVVLIKPGGVETEFVHNADSFYPQPIAGNPYGTMRTNFLRMMTTILDATNSAFPILKPTHVAQAIYTSAIRPKPETRVRIGRTAKIMPLMKSLLSDRAFDKMIMNQLGLLKP